MNVSRNLVAKMAEFYISAKLRDRHSRTNYFSSSFTIRSAL